ncbi:hypothetical protein OG21DRAFT_1517531 [Imleria badia]|nr:hypothetical protein OG21DRAFT_1517531 [Imleria badia]
MSGPESGKYFIQVAEGRRPLIGADFGAVKPIVADGPDRLWNVSKLAPGIYNLSLAETARYTQQNGGNVVATPVGAPAIWSIRAEEGGLYTIQVPGTSSGWTLWNTNPNSFVAVGNIDNGNLQPGQLWSFIRLPN